jgi:hypothetical protein
MQEWQKLNDVLDNMLNETVARGDTAAPGWRDEVRAVVREMIHTAVEGERHACSIAVWMTLQDALSEDADDKGLEGWMREAEARVKRRA